MKATRNLRYFFLPLITLLLLITESFGQTFPTSCTSKDLELVSAALPPPGNDPCACGGTRTLTLGINNKTSSERTAFAMWGTLKRYSSTNVLLSTESVFACAGPVPKNKISVLSSSTTITVSCGERLVIENLHLAWTSANDNQDCAYLQSHPSTINPKCGTLPSINVDLGVNFNMNPVNETCTTKGSIGISPFGGKAPYYVHVYGETASQTVAAGGTCTITGLSGGTHTFTVYDDNGCSITLGQTLSSESITTPSASVTAQPTCASSTGTVTVSSAVSSVTYTLRQAGSIMYTANGSGIFAGVAAGTYSLVATKGSTCTATGSDITVNASLGAPPAAAALIISNPDCSTSTGTVRIVQASGNTPYSNSTFEFSNNGTTWTTTTDQFVFVAGGGYNLRVRRIADNTCVTAATCSNTSGIVPTAKISEELVDQIKIDIPDGLTVDAYPNPYTSKIRFIVSSPEIGNGSLELYNMLGQKVRSVYQGRINQGLQAYEVVIPAAQRASLIYVMKLNGRQVTGKLLNSRE